MERLSTTEELAPEARTARLGASPDAPGSGLILDRYRLDRRLGAGGFGVVWLAYDERLEREVAVKVIAHDPADPTPERAEREARVAARLNHPGIVALYELAADDQAVYLVSELVRGRTFADLVRGGALADRDVARIGVALCDALSHAHARDVIHRDVKPQNVLVVAEPAAGSGFAKLADFGVAYLAGGDPLTRTGDVVGTLAYMAPEQAEGRRAEAAADVYSLALTLYEGFAGGNPVRAGSPAATARRLGRTVPSLAGRRRHLPLELCRMVDAALDPRPERRPSLDELREELDAAAEDLSDEGGLVEPATQRRFGLGARDDLDPGRRRLGLLDRLGAGAGAGVLALVALETLGPTPPVAPAGAACAIALAVALLPRIGWLAGCCAVLGWLVSPEADRAGTALVLAAALAPVPLLLPRAGRLWSVPALAPLLGVIGLAPMFVAVAALASTTARRAGLAVAGFLWLAAAEALTGTALLFGAAEGTLPRSDWEGSFAGAATDALIPAVTSPALVPLALWAALAVALPVVVRGRSFALDLAGGAVWAAALVAGHRALGDALAGSVVLGDARGAVAGAVLGLVVAVAAAGAGLRGRPLGRNPLS